MEYEFGKAMQLEIAKIAKLQRDNKALLEALKEMLCWNGPDTAAAMGCKCETLGEAEEQAQKAIQQAEGAE